MNQGDNLDKGLNSGIRPGRSKRQRSLAVQLIAQHFLYFLPEPQGHGSLRPTFVAGGA